MSRLPLERRCGGLTALLLCSLILPLIAACRSTQPEEIEGINEDMDLKLTVASDKNRYEINEPISVTVTLHNTGAQNLTVNGRLLLNHASAPEFVRDLFFEIIGPEGYGNFNSFRVNAGAPRPDDLVELAPGEVHQRVIELTRFHSLHLPGEYTLVAHYLSATPVAGFNVWQGSLQSEPIILERR